MLPVAASDSHTGGRVWLCAHLGAGWGTPPSLRRCTPVSGRSSTLLIHGVCYYCSLNKTCLNRRFFKDCSMWCNGPPPLRKVPSFAKPPLSAPKNNSQRNELETSVGPCSVPVKGSLDGGVCLEGGIWSAFCRAHPSLPRLLPPGLDAQSNSGWSLYPSPKLLFAENNYSQFPSVWRWWKTSKKWEIWRELYSYSKKSVKYYH